MVSPRIAKWSEVTYANLIVAASKSTNPSIDFGSFRGNLQDKIAYYLDRIRHIKCDESRPQCRRCLTHGVICDGYAPIKPKISPKKRDQEKSTVEACQDCDALPPALCYTPLLPPAPLKKQCSMPRRNQSVVFLEELHHSALPLSLASLIAETPESELAPIKKQLPLRNDTKLPSIAELVQCTTISATFKQGSAPRANQGFSLPKLADFLIESAGSSRLISLDRSCDATDHDGSVLLPRLRQPFYVPL